MRKRRCKQSVNTCKQPSTMSTNAEVEVNVEANVEEKKELSDKSDLLRIEFEECWKLYPDKTGKDKAFIAYQKAYKTGTTQQDVLSGINRYLAYVKHRQQTDFKDLKYANGSTWFHQKRWVDEYTTKSTNQPQKYVSLQ